MIHRIDNARLFGVPPGTGIESLRVAEAPIADALGELDPLEWEAIAGASPVRVHEFTAGRCLARALLTELGADHPVVLRARDRSPVWPIGFAGSIAHSETMCLVVVARTTQFESVGVDVEQDAGLEDDLLPEIATERELVSLRALEPGMRARMAQRLFVAKEAVYKCLHPIDQEFLRFQDVEVEFASAAPDATSVSGGLVLPALQSFRVRCAVSPTNSDARLVGLVAGGGGLVRAFAFVPSSGERA